MNTVTVQSRIDPTLKIQAETVFAGMGMSTADAIRIFLQQTVNEGGLPFKPHAGDLSYLKREIDEIQARLDNGEEELLDGEAFFADVAKKYGLE
ncbi:MAG: type II toxin-antitoxin system RelB/DinJ family antitoxin [Rickettsiales bacterium]